MADKDAEKKLIEIYKARLRDRKQFTSKRRRQLAQHPQKLGGLLHDYFEEDSQALRRIEESRAIMAWDSYVGESAARVSMALRIRNGTMLVKVDDPLWMQQLSLLKQTLIRKYRADFPRLKLQDIFFTRTP